MVVFIVLAASLENVSNILSSEPEKHTAGVILSSNSVSNSIALAFFF